MSDPALAHISTGAVPRPPVALYVHVPFCVSLCPYCDFVVYAGAEARGRRSRLDAFVDALATELELRADALDRRVGPPAGAAGPAAVAPVAAWPAAAGPEVAGPPDPRALDARSWAGSSPGVQRTARPPLDSVYLGGGTPSLLSTEALTRILDLARARFGLARDAEVTIEANPGPDERGDARELAAAGVTRLSLGAQSFDAGLLRRLGRRHRPSDVAEAVGAARRAGIRSISIDLLYDVPGQTPDVFRDSLEAALSLEPDHLSLYALTLDDPDAEGLTGPLGDHLPTTAGARRWRLAAKRDQDDDRAAVQYAHATTRLEAAGYRGYEISNWARPGHESRHNLAYWRRRPHEAAGPGAHAFDGTTRRWNAARLDGYLAALAPGPGSTPSLPPGGSEAIDPGVATAEATILALRLDDGLSLDEARSGPLAPHLVWALDAGLIEPFAADAGPRVRLTVRGRLLSNELFARLV